MSKKSISRQLKRPAPSHHTVPRPPAITRRDWRSGVKKYAPIIACGVIVLLLTACGSSHSGPDMSPIGDGLKVIGFALLGAAVVFVLGALLG